MGSKFSIKMKENAPKRIVHRLFPIPKAHKEKFVAEIQRLYKIGILHKLEGAEAQGDFAFPAFTILKKDGINIRFVSDFRKLNEHFYRAPYLILPAKDILNKMEGFKYATTINLNMGYWHIKLDLQS